ncbi:MAG: hypothetical protein KDE27_23305 [Planctomycetes bacterium]|nr:hypothetical protein [Planctomycetota bacterium]
MHRPLSFPRFLPACALVLLGAGPLLAQRAPAQPPAHGDALAGSGVIRHEGALLGVGRTYRATFGERGVEFVPALGKHAPRLESARFTTATIARGNDVVLATANATPTCTHDRFAVRYEWPGVVERYETRADGLELSYVFAARPAGAGDLAVRIAVATALPPALPAAANGRVAFLDERGRGVTIGEVTGIDQNGARCAGAVRHVDGGLELCLPAEFVDRAAYPLVLDPLIGTAVEAWANADTDFADVAYDAYTDTYCVVWTQFLGGGATGVVGSVWQRQGPTRAYAFAVNQSGYEDSVRVCHIAGTGVFVMMWVNRASAGDSICGLAFEPSQAQATGVFTLYGPGVVASPVLSGEATVYDDDCLVAWLDGTYGLLGCSLQVDSQLQVGATPIVQIAGGNVTEPAISKQGGVIGRHVVTWIDRPIGNAGWVRAQVVDHDMNLVGPGVWVQNVPQDSGYPAVDGDGFLFLVAWEQQEAGNPSGYDIKGRTLTVGGSGVTSLGTVQDLVTWPGDLDIAVDVARLHDRFGICYEGRPAANPQVADVYFLAVARSGAPIGYEHRADLTTTGNYLNEYAPRLIGRCAGDASLASVEGLLVFSDQSLATADANVGLVEIAAMGAGGAVTDLGGGCGPGGLAAANGPFALGNDAFAVELFGAQPLAVPFVLVAFQTPHQTCGVCSAVQPWHTAFVPNVAGYATAPLPLPGDGALLGLTLELQFATFGVNYVGCPFAPGLAASNILRATLDY